MIMMDGTRRILSLMLITGTLLSLPFFVFAEYNIRPLVVDLDMEPRAQARESITISNQSERTQRVYATVNAVTVDGDDTITEFATPAESDNRVTATSWFEVSRGRIEVPAGQEYELPVRVQVHPQAEPGIYHVLLGVAGGSNRPAAEDRVRSGAAPGTLFRIEIADDRTAYLQLRSFSTDRLMSNVAASTFSYTIENPSDTPLIPDGEIILYDSRGREVTAIPANPERITVDAGSSHQFTPNMSDEIGWGQHRALLSVAYGDGQRATLTDTIFFYHVPWIWLSVIFIVLLFFSIAVAYWLHRRYYASAFVVETASAVPLRRRAFTTRTDSNSDVRITKTDYESHT